MTHIGFRYGSFHFNKHALGLFEFRASSPRCLRRGIFNYERVAQLFSVGLLQ